MNTNHIVHIIYNIYYIYIINFIIYKEILILLGSYWEHRYDQHHK